MANPEAKKTYIVKIDIDKLHGTIRFESKGLHYAESQSDLPPIFAYRKKNTVEHQRTFQNEQEPAKNSVTLHRTSVAPASQTRWQGLGHDTMQLRNSSTISDTHAPVRTSNSVAPETSHLSTRKWKHKTLPVAPNLVDANQAFDLENFVRCP